MIDLIFAALTVGVLTVVLCTSKMGEEFVWTLDHLAGQWNPLHCTFCTTCWLAAVPAYHYGLLTWGPIVAVANLTVLTIHASISTSGGSDGDHDEDS